MAEATPRFESLARIPEAREKVPFVKKTADFILSQYRKSQAAQEEFYALQRNLSRPLAEALRGRKLTEEEVARLPVVDPSGFAAPLKAVGGAVKAPTNIKNVISFVRSSFDFIKPTLTRISKIGEKGKSLATTIERAADIGEVAAGKRVASIMETGLKQMTREDRFALLDTLEGRIISPKPNVQKAAQGTRIVLDKLAEEAQAAGVQTKFKTTLRPEELKGKVKIPAGLTPFQRAQLEAGKAVPATLTRPFAPRADYFPHRIPDVNALKGGETRKDIIENLVRLKAAPDTARATEFLDDFIDFLDNGKISGRRQSILDYMVKTGQAKDEAEALANLQRFRNRTIKRQGSLEYAREVDLPFYDPDPLRVLPQSVAEQSKRLAQIREFGQSNKVINQLISGIRKSNGDVDADFARSAVDRILGIVNNQNTRAARVSNFVRTLQGFRLGLAAIPNVTQGFLNTLLAGDLKAVAAGFRGILTRQGRQLGLRSGATLESTLHETIESVGGTNRALGRFLNATGFSGSERLNRIFAANGGASIAQRLFRALQKNPKNQRALLGMRDLGLNPETMLARGSMTDDDILLAAKKFSDMTQFRARPQDIPYFASSPEGKVFFQFKNFIYGQTRLLHKVLIEELRRGNYARATRNFLILASVFPITGEIIADVRSIVTGRKRESEGLLRYFENIAQTGAMGIFMDLIESSKYGTSLVEALVGPTLSEVGRFGDIGADILRGETGAGRRLGKELTKRIPFLGQVIAPRAFPSKTTESSSGNRFDR